MRRTSFDFFKAVSQELDPDRLQKKFLNALLELQNVERGSIWVKRENGYQCVVAAGSQSEEITGVTVRSDHPSIVGWVIENRTMTIAEPGKDERHYKDFEKNIAVKSRLILCFPLFLRNGDVYGAVQIIDTSAGGNRLNLRKEYLQLLQNLVDIGSIALGNSLLYSDQLKENMKLKEALDVLRGDEIPLGKSPSFLKVMKLAEDYARTDFPVLVTGESGTGKELIAKEIHRFSKRRGRPFLVQNCSAIPDTLLESELFGYRKGAFTGADSDKTGLFEAANGGTVFLDEIGDMPSPLQARILRVLQNGEVKPLGGTGTRKVDVRIISATNKDLGESIARGEFREDLFYRLNVLPLRIPPLRERVEDIPLLLDHFMRREALRLNVPARGISKDVMDFLLSHEWRGNVRELENFVKHILVVSQEDVLTGKTLKLHFSPGSDVSDNASTAVEDDAPSFRAAGSVASLFEGRTWEEVERAYVLHLLEKNRWHITRAAREAGVNRSTFDSRMRRLSIRR